MTQRILVEATPIKLRQMTAFATNSNKEILLAVRHHSRNAHCLAPRFASPEVLDWPIQSPNQPTIHQQLRRTVSSLMSPLRLGMINQHRTTDKRMAVTTQDCPRMHQVQRGRDLRLRQLLLASSSHVSLRIPVLTSLLS